MPTGPVLLDLTRTSTRVNHRAFTGVDRVELAWLKFLHSTDIEFFGLIRTKLGFLLLDRNGCSAYLSELDRSEKEWAENITSILRAHAIARATRTGLSRMLNRSIGRRVVYLNLGLSNFKAGTLKAIRSLRGSLVAVMVHDAIPIDHPEWQRGKSSQRLSKLLKTVSEFADVIVYPSASARKDVERHMQPPVRRSVVAPIAGALSSGNAVAPEPAPYFVILGTIEPRKNHRMLFQVWRDLLEEPPESGLPRLVVVGARGWASDEVFRTLDELKSIGVVDERNDLADAELIPLLQGSRGLLFPSLAEGFGLPATEALALRIPTICSQLPVFYEILGDKPIYLDAADPYSWRQTIIKLMDLEEHKAEQSRISAKLAQAQLPSWEDHFNAVLSAFD